MRLRLVIALCVGLGVATAVAVIVLAHSNHPEPPRAASARSSTAATPPPPLSTRRADQFTAALASGTDPEFRSVVALSAGQQFQPDAIRQIAALGPITFDVPTFHDDHDGTATVTATVAHPQPGQSGKWTVELVSEAGQWKLSLTESTP